MYQILNYNKSSNRITKYKLFKFLSIVLSFSFLCMLIFFIFNPEICYKPVGVILFVAWVMLYVLFTFSIFKLYRKHFNCGVYILNEESKELYKMGIFPNVIKFKPSDEDFLNDNYFANFLFSNIKRYFKLRFIKELNYSTKEFAKDNVSLKAGKARTTLYLNTLIKLNDRDYVLQQLNNRKFNGIVFKITKIYFYEFDDNGYYIICDVIENNKKIEYKNVKLTINKSFEENNIIKNYIISNCENNKSEN